jgi:hypothetical protein
MSVKSLDLKTSHAYHFKIALQRLWDLNDSIAESYLMKRISWASRSGMPDTIKLGKTMKRHLNGILEAIKSGINSAVVEGLNNKIRTAFKRSYGFKAEKYRDTIIYLVAGGLRLPPECRRDPEKEGAYVYMIAYSLCLCRFVLYLCVIAHSNLPIFGH